MDPRIVELLSRLAEVEDAQLLELEDILVAQLEEAAETKDVETARSLAEAIDNVKKESLQRAELARQREEEIKEIMSRVHGSQEDNSETTNPDDDKSDDDKSDDDEKTSESTDEPATTTASSKDRPLPKIADLARRRANAQSSSSRTARTPERTAGTTTVVAASDVPGISAGTEIPDRVTLRKAMIERWQAMSGSRTSGRLPVAKIQMNYPEDRVLRAGDEDGNWEKMQKLLSPAALLASGGICAPPQGFYDTNTLATAARPLRDSLVVFGAERGGIRFIPSISVADVTGAIGITTEAQDAAGPTKPCLVITCEDVEEATVQAIHRCLQFGNFNARTHPEYVSHISDLTLAAHARTAEEELWQGMCAAATQVTTGEQLSAWRDLYDTISRAAASFRSRHRMSSEAVLRAAIPSWVADMLSVDLVKQHPGDNTIAGWSRQQFSNTLRGVGIAVTWTLEGSTSKPQVFGSQVPGPLLNWPRDVQLLLYPEGSYLFLDGGTLDLGIVRDSTLNTSNDFQTFAESFETVAFIGPEALCITADLCANGLAAGSDDNVACVS